VQGVFAALIVVLLVLWSWPEPGGAILFPDSLDYLKWPADSKESGLTRLGPRMPSYPILLRGTGVGAALVHWQIWLSLAAWSQLGWLLAGAPGLLLGGLFSLSPELRFWSYAVLTESVTTSLLALLISLGLVLTGRWRTWLLVAWALVTLVFGLLRPSNALILPFLWIPFALQVHDLEHWRPLRAGLRPHGRRLVAASLVAVGVMATGVGLAERSGFWRMNYYISMLERVAPDAEARAYFADRGLELPIRWKSEAFADWFEESARSTYESWVVSRPRSYLEAWQWMAPARQREVLVARYVEPDGGPLVDTPGSALAEWVFTLTAPPRVVWAAVVLLPLAIGVVSGRLGLLPLWAISLAMGAYVQSFFTYHASAAEEMRHTLCASLMYRLAFVLALHALYQAWRRRLLARDGRAALTTR
jgi:hypothetical protein